MIFNHEWIYRKYCWTGVEEMRDSSNSYHYWSSMGFVKTTTSSKITHNLKCWIPENPNTINPVLNLWVSEYVYVCVCVAKPLWPVTNRSASPLRPMPKSFLDSNAPPTYRHSVVTLQTHMGMHRLCGTGIVVDAWPLRSWHSWPGSLASTASWLPAVPAPLCLSNPSNWEINKQ